MPAIDPGPYSAQMTATVEAAPAAPNLLQKSEAFDDAVWNKSGGATITPNTSANPADAAQTADTWQSGTVEQPVAVPGGTAGKTLTFSVWVRAASGTQTFEIKSTHGGVTNNFSGNRTATTTWQRFSFTVTNGAAAGTGQQIVGLRNASTPVYLWGAQLNEGASPSTYQPKP